MRSRVLIIYTGGTIGMVEDPQTGQLKPFDFESLTDQIPELAKLEVDISSASFEEPIDSSDMLPEHWTMMTNIILDNYDDYDGFVILHGSDTMAFTASALSFMLENLSKPVILTGSQLPIGMIRTDGKENIITAIEIAALKENGLSIVNEVCIYFENQLYRGNRTHKYNAEHFQAFHSPNYPVLAEAGVHIKFNRSALAPLSKAPLRAHRSLDGNVVILKLFPGLSECIVHSIIACPDIRAIVLETFGAGNATTKPWFISALKSAINKGVVIVNVTQCQAGAVEQGRYSTSASFEELGIISGHDITTEAAVTKLMWAIGQNLDAQQVRSLMNQDVCGEMTIGVD